MRAIASVLVAALVLWAGSSLAADLSGTNPDGSTYPIHLDAQEAPELSPGAVADIALRAKSAPVTGVRDPAEGPVALPRTPKITRMDLVPHNDLSKIDPRLSGTKSELVWLVQMRGDFISLRRLPGLPPIRGREGYLVVSDENGKVLERGFSVDTAPVPIPGNGPDPTPRQVDIVRSYRARVKSGLLSPIDRCYSTKSGCAIPVGLGLASFTADDAAASGVDD